MMPLFMVTPKLCLCMVLPHLRDRDHLDFEKLRLETSIGAGAD